MNVVSLPRIKKHFASKPWVEYFIKKHKILGVWKRVLCPREQISVANIEHCQCWLVFTLLLFMQMSFQEGKKNVSSLIVLYKALIIVLCHEIRHWSNSIYRRITACSCFSIKTLSGTRIIKPNNLDSQFIKWQTLPFYTLHFTSRKCKGMDCG